MVNPVGRAGLSPLEPTRMSPKQPVIGDSADKARVGNDASPALRLAKLGPPIDMNRIGEIQAAIANGSYTIDADRLAEAMLALDLPGTKT